VTKIVVDTIWIGGPQDDEDDPANWKEITVEGKYIVCPTCRGEGKTSNHLGAFTRAEAEEWGEDFMDDYMAGFYDKVCEECKGNRVTLVPDRENSDPTALQIWDMQQEDERRADEMYRMEMQAQYGPEYMW
jgi:hypothetical protein